MSRDERDSKVFIHPLALLQIHHIKITAIIACHQNCMRSSDGMMERELGWFRWLLTKCCCLFVDRGEDSGMESQKEQKVREDNLLFLWRLLKFYHLSELVSSCGKKRTLQLMWCIYLFIFFFYQIQDGIYMYCVEQQCQLKRYIQV